MKNFICVLIITMFFCSCGGQSSSGDGLDTTKMEKPDSESIVSMAQVMGEDLMRFLHEDDIQSAAALCQEGLDNIMYFRDIGDMESADIYTTCLHKFVKKHYDGMEDMATQNYVIKQFMAAVGDSAILHAQRRRWPQEEDTHNEPTVEADEPLPARPAVRHWRKQNNENAEVVTQEEHKAKPSETANRGHVAAKKSTTVSAKKPVVSAKKPVASTKKPVASVSNKTKSVAKQTSSGQRKPAAGAGNKSQVKQKREPIVVKCKKQKVGNQQQTSGEGTSSQWYLVRPLD